VAEQLDPAMVADCMGEIANIIAGQAKALLHGTPNHFVFSTPTVTLGEQKMVFKDKMTSLVIAFECEQGPFALQLCR
jgi:CheY-specific phosphatase CheX